MSSSGQILASIITEFTRLGEAQGPRNRFVYIQNSGAVLTVLRENGNRVDVPHSRILDGIEAVKNDPSIYDAGPSSLQDVGIKHISSPIWALLRLVPQNEY